MAHLVTTVELLDFETLSDDFGTTLNDSPKSELDLRPCWTYHECQHTQHEDMHAYLAWWTHTLELKDGETDGGETNTVDHLAETVGKTAP